MQVRLSFITFCLFWLPGGSGMAEALPTHLPDEETARVVMRGRAFIPARTILHQDRKTRLVFQNPDDRDHFQSLGLLPPHRPVAIVNGSGIDLDHFASALLPERPIFLMISRLLGDKGVREFVAAAEILKNAGHVGRMGQRHAVEDRMTHQRRPPMPSSNTSKPSVLLKLASTPLPVFLKCSSVCPVWIRSPPNSFFTASGGNGFEPMPCVSVPPATFTYVNSGVCQTSDESNWPLPQSSPLVSSRGT